MAGYSSWQIFIGDNTRLFRDATIGSNAIHHTIIYRSPHS